MGLFYYCKFNRFNPDSQPLARHYWQENLFFRSSPQTLYSQIKKLASAENRSVSQQIIFLAREYLVKRKGFRASKSPAQVLLELSGSWVDKRTPELIIKGIKRARKNPR
jgi:hypothetical protein